MWVYFCLSQPCPTDPRINAGVVTPSCGLFLTCRGEKCVQYCTIIYSVQCLHAGF
jgi:hypothetical protein